MSTTDIHILLRSRSGLSSCVNTKHCQRLRFPRVPATVTVIGANDLLVTRYTSEGNNTLVACLICKRTE
jgi:hypothetical protein